MTRASVLTFVLALGFTDSLAMRDAEAVEPRDTGRPRPLVASLSPPAWLGVTMDRGGDAGVAVEHVVRGSPADKGGIRVGDRIVSVDGAPVTDPGQVTSFVAKRRAGESVALSLSRAGSKIAAPIVLATRPSGDEILRMDVVGTFAPAWTRVTPLAGAPATMNELRGRVVIVDFWATWCGPCRMLAPRLSAMKDRFGAQGLSVVGITTDPAEKAALFAERNQMRYGVVVDEDGDTSKTYGITSLPTMLVVDKRGVVREVYVGYDPGGEARLEAVIKELLAEPTSGPTGPDGSTSYAPTVPEPTSRPRPGAR